MTNRCSQEERAPKGVGCKILLLGVNKDLTKFNFCGKTVTNLYFKFSK